MVNVVFFKFSHEHGGVGRSAFISDSTSFDL